MQSFAEFSSVRTQLLARCDALADVWADVQAFQSESGAEVVANGDVAGDVVGDAIGQVRQRLDHSVLEIGVFGEVKRGKSTLLNALLGREVSSMRVVPETAVPVWVEQGTDEAVVIYADGRTELVDDPDAAMERMSQRFRRKRPKDPVVRVIQRVEVDWLPPGVRVIDTPGLADPSLSADYQQLTLSELDRVAAAVFVFVSPPGIAREEEELLRTLADRGVEKLFLVCNFYPDQWADEDARRNVTDMIRQTVSHSSTEDAIGEDRVNIYQVNARDGLIAALRDDAPGLEESGVAALRRDLEGYLAETAMTRLTARCHGYLHRAKSAMLAVLSERVDSLRDRTELVNAKARLQEDFRRSKDALREIEDVCLQDVAELRQRLEKVVTGPFEQADALISQARTTSQLEGVHNKLHLASETAANKASAMVRSEVSLLEERIRRRLYDTFGFNDELRANSRASELVPVGTSIRVGLVEGQPDPSAIGVGAGLGGAAGGLVGGSLAGGLGIALIASGPVGWLIGAGLGVLAGGALGGGLGAMMTWDSLNTQEREELRAQLLRDRHEAALQVRELCDRIREDLVRAVTSQRDSFLGGRAAELARIDEILSDRESVHLALKEARSLRARVQEA